MKEHLSPVRITAIYVTFGVMWILFSDAALNVLVQDPGLAAKFQTLKGWLFIAVTGAIVYGLVDRMLAGIRRGIEERERAEEKLRDSEVRFRRMFGDAEISLWQEDMSEVKVALDDLRRKGIVDLRWHLKNNKHMAWELASKVKVPAVNPATLKMFGAASEKEFIYQIDKTFGPDAIEVFIEVLCAIWEGKKKFRSEASFRSLDDGRIIEAIMSFRIPERNEEFASIPVSMTDITERKAMESALRESEERFYLALDNIPDSVVIYDADLKMRFVNASVLRAAGLEREEMLGKGDEDIFQADICAKYLPVLTEARDSGEIRFVEAEIAIEPNKIRQLKITCIPVLGEYGSVREIVGITRDYTEQKAVESSLRHAQRMEAVGQLTGGLAHDLNNVLSIVSGNVEILGLKMSENRDIAGHVGAAMMGVRRAADLTRKLLDFSRREAVKTRQICVNEFVQGMSTLIAKSLTPAIALKMEVSEKAWNVDIDTGDFENAILNLSLNSRDAMMDGGVLVIETRNVAFTKDYPGLGLACPPGEYVMIAVSDTGIGMSPDEVEKAFEPFYTTKEIGRGTGLGLSMVYGFVKRSGGHIEIQSKPGAGTTVRMFLPRADGDEKTDPATEADLKNLPGGTEKILVVDDEIELLETAQLIFKQLGYEVIVAKNGREAMSILEADESIDLLFSDVIMPGGINGYRLAINAKKRRADLKVLLTSGFTRDLTDEFTGPDQEIASALKGNVLHKPYTFPELANAVRLVLTR